MAKYFYLYHVTYWDMIETKMKTDTGFTRAECYSEAVAEISEWYGEDQIESLHIEILEDGDGPLTISMLIDVLGSNLQKHDAE